MRSGAKDSGQRGVRRGEWSKGRWAKERQKGNPVNRSETSEVNRHERSVCEAERPLSTSACRATSQRCMHQDTTPATPRQSMTNCLWVTLWLLLWVRIAHDAPLAAITAKVASHGEAAATCIELDRPAPANVASSEHSQL